MRVTSYNIYYAVLNMTDDNKLMIILMFNKTVVS